MMTSRKKLNVSAGLYASVVAAVLVLDWGAYCLEHFAGIRTLSFFLNLTREGTEYMPLWLPILLTVVAVGWGAAMYGRDRAFVANSAEVAGMVNGVVPVPSSSEWYHVSYSYMYGGRQHQTQRKIHKVIVKDLHQGGQILVLVDKRNPSNSKLRAELEGREEE